MNVPKNNFLQNVFQKTNHEQTEKTQKRRSPRIKKKTTKRKEKNKTNEKKRKRKENQIKLELIIIQGKKTKTIQSKQIVQHKKNNRKVLVLKSCYETNTFDGMILTKNYISSDNVRYYHNQDYKQTGMYVSDISWDEHKLEQK